MDIETVVQQWKKMRFDLSRKRRFPPAPHHICIAGRRDRPRCKMTAVRIFACPVTGACLGQPYCQTPHAAAWHREIRVYFCEGTGLAHYCGAYCDRSINVSDGGTVCELTGLNVGERRQTNGLFGDVADSDSIGRVMWTSMVREMTTETIQTRMHDLAGGNLGRAEKTFHGVFAHLSVHVATVFSPQRFAAERQEVAAQDHAVRAALIEYISSTPFPDFVRAAQIACAMRRRYPRPVSVVLTRERVDQIVPLYARRVIALWAILRRHIPNGRDITRMHLRDFALMALELGETGITVRDRTGTYPVTIMHRDALLSVAPITPVCHRIVRGDVRDFSAHKATIIGAIQAAIRHGTSPEIFRVEAQMAQIERFPVEVFR